MLSLQDTITQYQLHANKKLGQHFLTDQSLLEQIVRAAHVPAGMHVIEIGPGPGGLTRALLASDAASLTVVELDRRCMALLRDLQASDARLTIVEGDAMKQDVLSLAPAPRAIVANLPYNVGSQLMIHWLKTIHETGADALHSITVMLQKEVVDRMAAAPGSKDYGRLSVLCQWLCEVQPCFDVPPEAFSPPPKVMSSIVRLAPREQPLFDASFAEVSQFLTAAFGQRRKMLRSSLKGYHAKPEALLESCDIDPTRRAETLTLEEVGRIIAVKG